MTIIIKRGPEVAGGVIKLKVWTNNEQVTKVALGEKKDLILPKENSVIQIKQFSGRSKSLIVNDGDQVTISNGPVFRWMIVVLSIYIPLIVIFDGP